jgi:hypothetical protein
MNLIFVPWIGLGLLAGAAHAAALWQAARGWRRSPVATLWRWPLAIAALASAAMAGRILPAAVGWAIGMAGATSLIFVRRRS